MQSRLIQTGIIMVGAMMLAPLGAATTPTLPPLSEKLLGPAPGKYDDIEVSADGLLVGLFAQVAPGQFTLTFDGKKSAPFTYLLQWAPSPDFQHVAYLAPATPRGHEIREG